MSDIKKNLEVIKEKIDRAAQKSGRKGTDITVIAVTKTIDVARINELISYGIQNIGENKAQELRDKYPQIDPSVNWHFIGHLQSNKIKYIIDKVKLIHSVDSEKLAYNINEAAKKHDKVMDILLQVNVAEDENKFGLSYKEVEPLLYKLKDLKNIRVRGLMTIVPYDEEAENNRLYFRRMKQLAVDIDNQNIDNISMEFLSMGMTNDFEIAIEEGSNMVRIGTGIFGARNYNM
ncbi:MAG TPA: YggS family pyridoxal phosphate-dependent enzyme [Defluviitaleaceae bacterium]|jgi:pyridoxal phosphate enzyme (YggS family)|nr:YggS family pyridoxal phosphate-dependent enzyme [Candidatus Epulonipiscium sp.]HOQ17613.1 YggS family pyridoxal phosphate-dependent enzyme [Defluviitaleaceae bacterium]HPT76870.1 YggS family pyridoxal phosphate-dependent enzyme [Defluviitaleaceae bacterium]HQD50305.1 YggS family pyridoxal phosphate-dependent enzyme [Defluviitaleaceae bacterium]